MFLHWGFLKLKLMSKLRYNEAHHEWFKEQYPAAFKDGFYSPPPMPTITKANGLTKYITNFLFWKGHRATRVNVQGRIVKGKWIPSSTRKGTADISATIKGRSVMIEIKVGSDRARPEQLQEQERERKASGIYEFIRTAEEFLELYDKVVNL
jgi:hypothetical protein